MESDSERTRDATTIFDVDFDVYVSMVWIPLCEGKRFY